MPRTPLTIAVGPSRLAWGCQSLLALSVVLVLLRFASPWLAALGVAWLLWLGWHLHRSARVGELLALPGDNDTLAWRWREPGALPGRQPGLCRHEPAWRDVTLRCRYLGPCLLALQFEGRTLWLWPDSAPPDALRRLRRYLLAQR